MSFRKAQLLNEKPCQLFIDATGSIIKPHGQKVIYVYSLSGAIPISKVKSLPILEWISDRHNIATITNVLTTWKTKCQHLLPKPAIVTTDFSWALMTSVCFSFNENSVLEQIRIQWVMMTHGTIDSSGTVILRLCANHFIKMVSRRLSAMDVSRKVII